MFDEQSPSGRDYLAEVTYLHPSDQNDHFGNVCLYGLNLIIGFFFPKFGYVGSLQTIRLLKIFMAPQVCREWEGTASRVNKDVRLVLIRIGVVLGKEGGALGMV